MCLNELLHRVALLKNYGYKVIVLALDINNAYNCVQISKLVNILERANIPPIYIAWIQNFLARRILKLGDEKIEIHDGLPQGSCLSPLLFNMYTKFLHLVEDEITDVCISVC